MSKFGCTCGHTIVDQTDFLPYMAHIREDEDTQKPVELLADLLSQYWDARQQGQEADFMRHYELSRGATENWAEIVVRQLAEQSLSQVLADLIAPFWNNYDRTIYECEDCGRLWVQMEDGHFVAYLPETDTRHVLWSRHNHNPYGYLDE
jgi:hypothetical protein